MEIPSLTKLEERVYRAAEAALVPQHYVSAIDVLCGMGLLASSAVDSWRKGRIDFLNLRDAQCSECGAEIARGSMLLMEADQPLCLYCARLDGLEFLPAGDT